MIGMLTKRPMTVPGMAGQRTPRRRQPSRSEEEKSEAKKSVSRKGNPRATSIQGCLSRFGPTWASQARARLASVAQTKAAGSEPLSMIESRKAARAAWLSGWQGRSCLCRTRGGVRDERPARLYSSSGSNGFHRAVSSISGSFGAGYEEVRSVWPRGLKKL